MTFYDRSGNPVAYIDNRSSDIYLFDGTPVAYLNGNTVYSFRGKHLGWFEDGWVRDLNGRCSFFTENVRGSGPVTPVTRISPVPSVQRIAPIKSVEQVSRVRAVDSLSWSELSGKQFFWQQ